MKSTIALILALLALAPAMARGQSYESRPGPDQMAHLLAAAERGEMKAQRLLGDIWSSQNNHRRDFDEAVKWYRAAAEQGSPRAQYRLAQLYQSGTGVLQDRGQAVRWFTKAAGQGDAKAMVDLGQIYYGGPNTDKVHAHFWFNVAAREGNGSGEGSRNIIATGMTPAQIAKAERMAREWSPKRPPKCVLDESCVAMVFKESWPPSTQGITFAK